MMDQIKYLLALESYKFMYKDIIHIRMIMINILYTFLVICFPDVMPTLAALTGGTQYLPQKIKCELHQKTGQYLKMQKAGKSNWLYKTEGVSWTY